MTPSEGLQALARAAVAFERADRDFFEVWQHGQPESDVTKCRRSALAVAEANLRRKARDVARTQEQPHG